MAIVAAAAVLIRRRASGTSETGSAQTLPQPAPPENLPMTGLEAALAEITDREGRPIGERIDAEAPLVDELRVPDDTGPVLRRALDRVEHHADDEPHDSADDHTDSDHDTGTG